METVVCLIAIALSVYSSVAVTVSSSIDNVSSVEALEVERNCLNACSNETMSCSEFDVDSCPPGLFCNDSHCECGVYPNHFISCNGSSAKVLRYFCVTFDSMSNLTVVGECFHLKVIKHVGVDYASNILYHQLPQSVNQLNSVMCKSLNRDGIFCGSCLPNHYPLAYSFNMTCIPCPHARWNWFRYIMAAYLPLTLFCFIILVFKINTTSSYLFSMVYYCQTVSLPFVLRGVLMTINDDTNLFFHFTGMIMYSLFGMWNLDFFRPFYSDLCLGMGVLPVLALDYAIALYPLLLMIVTYQLTVLHGRNYKIITLLWRPFRAICLLFRRNWDIKTSVMDAFATCFFLSSTKFLSVSFDLLIPTQVYQLHPDHYNYTLGLYFSGHVEYFGKEHFPYALLAVFVLCFFIVLPTLLLAVYPCQFCQRFLRLCPVFQHTSHMFVRPFYGSYHDGRGSTRDYRWFASVFLIIRLLLFSFYFVPDKIIFLVPATMTLMLHSTLVAVLQPYKSYHNIVNVLTLQLLTLFAISATGINFAHFLSPEFTMSFYILGFLFGALIPSLCGLAAVLYWTYAHGGCCIRLLRRFAAQRVGYEWLPGRKEEEEGGLPDRIEHSDAYPRENLANFTAATRS